MVSSTTEAFFAPNPAELDIGLDGSRRQQRVSIALRGVLVLPHLLVVLVLGVVGAFLAVVGWFAALAVGQLPRWIGVFELAAIAYSIRVSAYGFLLVDEYPPFALSPVDYPIAMELEGSHLSRLKVLFRWPLAIPAAVVSVLAWSGVLTISPLWLVTLALGGVVPVSVVSTLAWLGLLVFSPILWIVTLVLGRPPQPMFEVVIGVIRYQARCSAYAGLVTDFYPRNLFGDAKSDSAREGFRVSLSESAKWLGGLIVVLGIAGATAGGVLWHELTLAPPRNPAVVAAEGRLELAGINAVAEGSCDLRCEEAHERALGEAYLRFASSLSRISFPRPQRRRVLLLIHNTQQIGQFLLAASKSNDGGRAQGIDPADPGDSPLLEAFDVAIAIVLGPGPAGIIKE